MKSLEKKRRIQVILVSFLAIAGILVALAFLPKDAFQYFKSPSEVMAEPPRQGEVFRIGGLVEDGSLIRGEGLAVTFAVTDGGATVPVSFVGVLPDLFTEGQGMVGTGSWEEGVFHATEILAKHDEEYMPKEVVDALKEQGVYQHAGEDSDS
ncbi:cytochrome c maturation protein CcmE [Halocynthiibacter styelae]|uniref:Cytochrome c-type biogenesis protein CcmE n=1 Tax=Halocynthiibacter styelae TaxID=2761955 RepID=A0A8J7ILC1_9RHOB|nr:cytochrome c maturation protein CcmE [Paenihalocynthiibacter styelae]MBI1492376.1 cytochrome c maturation protein CcmE [Paenihalocynthiibacter styelae]